MDVQQESLLKKRKRDDLDKQRRLDAKAKQKMAQGRQKKLQEKQNQAGGKAILMPDVFVSNYMKQQRNFVHYKRFKNSNSTDHLPAHVAAKITDKQEIALPKNQRVALNSLLMIVRVKESRNSTP